MSPTPENAWPRRILVAVWALSTGLYTATSTMVFHSYIATSIDHAILEQVVARLSRLSAPITEVQGHGVNYFGDHFSPVLAVYAPFYRLVPEPETMFLVQGGVLGFAVVVIMMVATRHLGRLTGSVVTVLFALSFGLLNCTVMSARETPFAVLLLAVAGACYLERSTRGVVLASLGLLLVKEDLGLTVAAIGFVLATEARSRRAGVALMVTGVSFFVLVMAVIVPAFRGEGGESAYVTSPSAMLDAALDGWSLKLLTLILTFGAAGLLCLRSRWVLIALPTLAWRFTGWRDVYWTPLSHYSAPLMPIVFIATVAVLRTSPARERRGVLVIASALTVTTLAWAVTMATPVYDSFGSARHEAARQVLKAVPAGAVVASDQYLIGQLAGDRTTYYMAMFEGCPRPEYVVAHVGNPEPNVWGWRLDFDGFEDVGALMSFADAAYAGSHEVVLDNDEYAVIRRVASEPESACVPTDAGWDLVRGSNN